MTSNNGTPSPMARVRRLSLVLHRELGFLFAALICCYALSGILMNHRDSINPHYSVEVKDFTLPKSFPADREAVGKDDVEQLVDDLGQGGALSKYYFSRGKLRILLRGGSSIMVDPASRTGSMELISNRPILSDIVRLHYNPGRWWTVVSDIFAGALLLLTLTGIIIVRGRKGLIGRGGVLLLIGILVPVLFLLL